MPTPDMGLDLPVPGVTTGPAWANKLNSALSLVDSHDHSSGRGAAVSIGSISGAGSMARQNASAVSITGGTVTGLSAPVSASDAATKGYVDSISAPGTANAITLGFDLSGATAIGNLMFTASAACRAAGINEIVFPPGLYKLNGSENIAPSSTPHSPFRLRGLPGATLIPDFAPDPSHATRSIMAHSWGAGDTIAAGNQSTMYDPNSVHCVPFIMTVVGGEFTLTGFSDTSSISVGNTIVLYLGAELTDASGWPNSWIFATVVSKTGSTVVIDRPLPTPCPTPDGNVGINVVRTHQTHHTLRVVTGFNDCTEITGFTVDSTFFSLTFARYPKIDCYWKKCFFGVNATGCIGLQIDLLADKVTGYNQGGGGAFAHYGQGIALSSCIGTQINRYITDHQDGVGCVAEELSCRGTHVSLLSINSDATLSPTGVVQITGANGGATNIISIDHLFVRGCVGQLNVTPSTRIARFEDRGTDAAQNCFIRVDQCDSVLWKNQNFHTKKQLQTLIYPLPTTATTKTFTIPQNGLVSRMWVRISTLTGITAVKVDGTALGSECDVTSLITGANQWLDLNTPVLMAAGTPNVFGYCTPRIKITGNGSTPANNVLLVDIEMMIADMSSLGQPVMADTTPSNPLSGNGAPSANAVYLGQRYFDIAGKVWYTAKDIGTGASDWA